MGMLVLFFKLIIGHALADFVLQPTPMAKWKCRRRGQKDGLDGEMDVPSWPYWLSAHALIHGGVVWLVTNNITFGIVEVVLHWMIDFAKCEKKTNIHIDQVLHLLCKVIYVFIR
jgi:hypothetical protein